MTGYRQIVLDTETTGLETRNLNRIVEIGCVEMINRRPTGRTFHTYLKPDRDFEEGAQQDSTPATHAWLAQYDSFTDKLGRDVLTVGEVWDQTDRVFPYVANDELDIAFEFGLGSASWW